MKQMAKQFLLSIFLVNAVLSLTAQEIPAQLRGRWIVKRELPTSTICCWGEKESNGLIGTEIEYTADSFRWKNTVTTNPTVQIIVLSAEQFQVQYSGGGAIDSQVSFRQLGIRAPQATQIVLGHEPANLTGGTVEIPGDEVLIKNKNTIIFSVCNVYFEAQRRPASIGKPK
jgi:hypothetical protein